MTGDRYEKNKSIEDENYLRCIPPKSCLSFKTSMI